MNMLRRPFLGMLAALTASDSFALYDPPPNNLLRHLPGTWHGALTYRDWSKPDRLVNLPCRMNASLLTPTGLGLFFVFDDGPGNVVHSYDRWLFDFAKSEMVWAAGVEKEERTMYRIASATASDDGAAVLVLAGTFDGRAYRQRVESSARSLKLTKVEIVGDMQEVFRNGYEFSRADS